MKKREGFFAKAAVGGAGAWPAWPRGGGGLAVPRVRGGPRARGTGGRGPRWTAPAGRALAAARAGSMWTGRAGAAGRGPRWTARQSGRGAGGGAIGGGRELAVAALQGSAGRAEGMGGRGSARRARWRPHLREMTTAMRSSTAAERGSTAAARIRQKRWRRELGFRLAF